MSEIADGAAEAFADALVELGEAVTIDTQESLGIVTALRSDEVIVAGGVVDQGGYRINVAKSDFPGQPVELVDVLARGRTMHVLSVEEKRAHWTLVCGHVAA